MAQIPIINGQSGLVVRTSLNTMLTELYGSIVTAFKVPGQNATFQLIIPGNTKVHTIDVALANGSDPGTVRMGSNPNGTEYCEDIDPDGKGREVLIEEYFPVQTILYITIATATYNFRINQEENFY